MLGECIGCLWGEGGRILYIYLSRVFFHFEKIIFWLCNSDYEISELVIIVSIYCLYWSTGHVRTCGACHPPSLYIPYTCSRLEDICATDWAINIWKLWYELFPHLHYEHINIPYQPVHLLPEDYFLDVWKSFYWTQIRHIMMRTASLPIWWVYIVYSTCLFTQPLCLSCLLVHPISEPFFQLNITYLFGNKLVLCETYEVGLDFVIAP